MSELVRLDDEVITSDDLIQSLRFIGRFDEILEDHVKIRLVVLAAIRSGITLTDDEVQERADQLRRVRGLHRATDMAAYLEQQHATVDDFEQFVKDMLYHEKKEQEITSEAAVEEYFKLNSPKFDTIEIVHMHITGEGAAREIMAMVTDDPDSFSSLAEQHSVADTKTRGGAVGRVNRGSLQSDVEAKIFNSEVNVPIGPLPTIDDKHWEIFMVVAKHPATLDEPTIKEVRKLLMSEWIAAEARQVAVEIF